MVRGLRAGDVAALEACYRAFGARVLRSCRLLLGSGHDAEDATQEVFVKVFERAAGFEGRARLSTWLYRLTVNHCLNRIERERLRTTEPLELVAPATSGEAGPLERADRREAHERAQALLERLSPEHRAALVLREVEGLSYREIAEVVGVPVGTVMSRLARAREKLAVLTGSDRTAKCRRAAP